MFDPRNLPDQDDSVDVPVTPCDDDDDAADDDDANTAKTPATTAKSLQDYGDDIIRTMCSRFGLDVETALEEWGDYKQFSSDHQKKLKLTDVTHQLCTNQTQRQLYPHMSKLAQICCVIPPHTADCERDFSQLKFVKTNLRNRMKDKTLDSIIRIVIPCLQVPGTHKVLGRALIRCIFPPELATSIVTCTPKCYILVANCYLSLVTN